MASYLRPRRGRKSTAEKQNIILKRGEVFFEAPETGVGTGAGRLKMGDGTTPYKDLPYFLEPTTADVTDATVTFTEDNSSLDSTDNESLLNSITSSAKLNVIVSAIKILLTNLNDEIKTIKSSSLKTRTLLWSNPAPYTTGMPKDAVINLSSSDYDELEWVYAGNNLNDSLTNLKTAISVKGYGITLNDIVHPSGSTEQLTVLRTINWVSDTEFKVRIIEVVTHGIGTNHTSITTSVGRYLVPYKIYGIKYQ